MKILKPVYNVLLLLLFTPLVHAQINIVKNASAQSAIIVNHNDSIDMQAAVLLQDFVKRITGATLKIGSGSVKPKKGDILIGNNQLPVAGLNIQDIKEDGFYLSANDGYIRIVKGEGKGSIYGVVTLLEDYFNVRYYAQGACTYDQSKDMVMPSGVRRIDNPSFRYRQTQAYSLNDPIYKMWHRLESPNEVFADNLWVHTFNRLLPASEFGEKHPEYYSYINGKRRPGVASQWCLTNPDVFRIVAHRIDSIFRKNPGKKLISVSQNDSQTHCYCDDCRVIDEKEGSPSGTIIYFVNKLAERFPDKEFSTLAYLYSVPPPKYIKPLPNVNIMLCDIDCYREVTLTENPSGRDFVKDMEGWARITDNIFVWDYGINFDNYVSPFPNFHILQPNMELFKKNKATMHFSQIAGSKGGDFSELRSYVVSKLLWNTNADVDSLIQVFLKGYYGEGAAPCLYQYLKLQEGALIGSNIPLWIYDTPVTHKSGLLNEAMMRRYKHLFDLAEQAVNNQPEYLKRVREARLPVQYAELEIARTGSISSPDELKAKLDLFRSRSKEFGVTTLNERRNTIEEYCDLYIQRNLSHNQENIARGSSVRYILPPDAPYDKIADMALTDGLFGGATFNESWVGWEGKDAEFVIDLGDVKEFSKIQLDFLHKLGAWILLPKGVICSTSVDGSDYRMMGRKDIPEDKDIEVKYVKVDISSGNMVKARYIKVRIETIGLCPPWHYGVGNPAWFFIDEIVVN